MRKASIRRAVGSHTPRRALSLLSHRTFPLHAWPNHQLSAPLRTDCWAPDYCKPRDFAYKLCKLRMRKRTDTNAQYMCPEGEYCEELDCEHKCFLPPTCWCESEGPLAGRMMCTQGACFTHPSTQWGLCVPVPPEWEGDDDEPLPVPFHFYTPDPLLHNARLHINEDSLLKGELPGQIKDEL